MGGAFTVEVTTAPCDRGTGALLDATVVDGYRPPDWLVALVRARDGRCRFPGCSVAARFCDLDHVNPWPIGPTTAENLACLCRRHHRIKQRAGWRVRMLRGAALEWTDPVGRVRTTQPLDALHGAVLPRLDEAKPGPTLEADTRGGEEVTEPEFSRLEFALEHLLAGDPAAASAPMPRAGARRRVAVVETCRTAELRGLEVDRDRGRTGCGSGRIRPRPNHWPDEPPF